MKEFNGSSPNAVVFAMASLFLVSAILVSKGYYKGISWFIIPTPTPLAWTSDHTSPDFSSYKVLFLYLLTFER